MPRLLDLFCGAGGAAMGYHRAGFEVVGVDIRPQPHYPFEFHQADALEAIDDMLGINDWWWCFDAVHASPPCQRFSTMTARWHAQDNHPDLVDAVRQALLGTRLPFVLENVPLAPLENCVTLCGSHFGLPLRRHRVFETHCFECWRPICNHGSGRVVGVYGHPGGSSRRDGRRFASAAEWATAMGIDWMVSDELAEAIPPAYTEYIGQHLMAVMQ